MSTLLQPVQTFEGAGAVADRLAGYTPPTLRQLVQSCVLVWGGPWRVDHCEVRASGGVAVRVIHRDVSR